MPATPSVLPFLITITIVAAMPAPQATKRKYRGGNGLNKRLKLSGIASQPIDIDASQSQRLSPRKAIVAATQATEATAPSTFKSRLRDTQADPQAADAHVAPTEGSKAATVATAEDNNTVEEGFDAPFEDDFEGIDFLRLPKYMKPLATQKQKKSWVYQHGYRVALRNDPSRIFFVCRYCHQRKVIDAGGGGLYETTTSTSTSARHLEQKKRGHSYLAPSKARLTNVVDGSLRAIIKNGKIKVTQAVANELSGFDCQDFRVAAVSWLVENNHPLREFETPAFRAMLRAANPEAARALWTHHTSVSRFVMRLYEHLQPIVKAALSTALSKIHISFDGWTTKGGKRGFLGVVAHYVNSDGEVVDLPIALPQLTGAHSGEKIAEIVSKLLQWFGIDLDKIGYFVLDNASNNDTAVLALARRIGFSATHRRLRCGPHTLNLVGQTLLWGNDADAFDNDASNLDVSQRLLTCFARTYRYLRRALYSHPALLDLSSSY